MMTRYLLIAGHGIGDLVTRIQPRLGAMAPALPKVLVCESYALFTDDSAAVLNFGDAGFVIGTLFDSGGRRQADAQAAAWKPRFAVAGPASLCDRAWGSYLALGVDPASGLVEIMRDPSGGMPCYYSRAGRATVYCSDADTLVDLGLAGKGFDWKAVAAHIGAVGLRTSRTCLEDVGELLAGQVVRLGAAGHNVRSAWSPWKFAEAEWQFATYDEAVGAIRAVVPGTVRALADGRSHSVLGVSGGLDSSIIAVCLDAANARMTCATMATRDPRGDERAYARLLASSLGVDLVERVEDAAQVDITISHAAHLPRPVARAFAQSTNALFQKVADDVGADAFFSGGGGDNVFCHMQNVLPVVDRYRAHGASMALWQTVVDVSVIAGVNVWEVMRGALRRQRSARHGYAWPMTNRFLVDGFVVPTDIRSEHPWLAAPPGALPGKAAHIAWIMHIQNHLEGHGQSRNLPTIWPLMAQPVMETCLRIPTWMWMKGGRNRAVARDAFADTLPPAILNRRAKGTLDGFVAEIFELRRVQILDFLGEGLLQARGFLDMPALSLALRGDRPILTDDYNRIMTLVDVEAWLRAWQARSPLAPRRVVVS
jgi:asparagine synthase (glutamine-hydrolysing)